MNGYAVSWVEVKGWTAALAMPAVRASSNATHGVMLNIMMWPSSLPSKALVSVRGSSAQPHR